MPDPPNREAPVHAERMDPDSPPAIDWADRPLPDVGAVRSEDDGTTSVPAPAVDNGEAVGTTGTAAVAQNGTAQDIVTIADAPDVETIDPAGARRVDLVS